MPSLLHRLRSYRPFKALVVGDFMLDQHLYGAAERLSPDVPVPVLHAGSSEDRPGGAANVALCLRALEGDVICVGVVGDDAEGRSLCAALQDEACDVGGIVVDPSRPTTLKRSFIGLAQHRHPQKMFRVDVESRDPVDDDIRDALLKRVEARLDEVDVVCLEDYDKGVCSASLCRRLIEVCRAAGKPILVDPAAIEDYSKYRGATAITPNRSEAELATGLDTPLDASEVHNAGLAAKLGHELDLDAVVLTLDKHGALLEERGGDPVLVPTVARAVYDVTGAGDVVLAALAAARANGLGWLDAVRFSNAAAGLEVGVFGAQPIPFAAVQREILAQTRTLEGKVRTMEELLVEVAVHRHAGDRVVFTNGCFDVIHAGHVGYLREARGLGDVLIVAVNDDVQVRVQKGEGRPIYPIRDRLDILSELQCIDYLAVFDEPTVRELLREIRPDVYVKGGDYRPEEINEHDVVQELGIDLRVLAHRPGLGSTQVIEKLGPCVNVRAYDHERDRDAVHRIWRECGWLEDEQEAMDIALGIGRRTVAEHDGEAECFVMTAPGEMRYLQEDLPFSLVYAVTTGRVARKQGIAGRLTAHCVAADAADGAIVSGLGAFELGYYDRIGFGTGGYDHVFEFDPAQLRLPKGVKARPPKRLVPGDYAELHASRLRRHRCHVSCVFADDRTTRAELEWGKHGFGLGYRDRPDGGISHHVWLDTGGNVDHGPYRVRWMAYETPAQLLELLGLIRNLGDQVRLVRMSEPVGVQLQDLLEVPTRMRVITKGSKLAQALHFLAWWQMRILDLEACLAATKLALGPVAFNLRLTDPIEGLLPEDASWRGQGGDWIVTLGPASSAKRGTQADLPTMDASINAFTRLWLGVRPASGLAVTDRLAAPPELLDALDRVVMLPPPQPDWDF